VALPGSHIAVHDCCVRYTALRAKLTTCSIVFWHEFEEQTDWGGKGGKSSEKKTEQKTRK
jgi:hypothetical protein